jgi:hypothetical protein
MEIINIGVGNLLRLIVPPSSNQFVPEMNKNTKKSVEGKFAFYPPSKQIAAILGIYLIADL